MDVQSLIPVRGRTYILASTVIRPALRSIQPPIKQVSEALHPGLERSDQEAQDSPPSHRG
jgi:hypothetical protein